MKTGEKEQYATLNRIVKQKIELYHGIALQLGISDTGFSVLYHFCCTDNLFTEEDLPELLAVSNQAVNSAVTSLIKRGFVYLEDRTAACNNKAIRLTKEGTVFCQNKIAPVLNREINAFSRLTEEERNNLVSLSQIHHLFLLKELNGFLESIRSDSE